MSNLYMTDDFERCAGDSHCETRFRCGQCDRPVCHLHSEEHVCKETEPPVDRRFKVYFIVAVVLGMALTAWFLF